MRRAAAIAGLTTLLVLAPSAGADLKPHQVLVVVNDASPISQAIGQYYGAVRGIPAQNVLHLPASTPSVEFISRADYNAKIRDPIANYLQVQVPALKTQVRCILLTKGCPLTVANTTGSGTLQTIASVDSELTQLFTGLVPDNGQEGWLGNPYYGSSVGFEQFSSAAISYLVCRLDGYADALDPGTGVPVDIKGLIDRAQTPAGSGTFLLDGDPTKTGGYGVGETWMLNAKTALQGAGLAVQHDTTTAFQKNVANILGYCSWGSNDSNNLGAPYYGNLGGNAVPGAFLPGSLATDYVSTSGRTFAWPPSYGQSLTADLIRMGCTAANGHVAEPYLNACSQPDWVFPNYARGFTVAEAFYTSIAFLSWENVVVCDPLMKRMLVISQITTVTSNFGPQQGGLNFTIVGKNFSTLGDTAVTVGGTPAQVLSVTATQVVAKAPASGPGPRDIVLVNSSGAIPSPVPYVYTPALTTQQPTVALNTNWTFQIYGQHFADKWTVLDGAPAAAPLPIPPFGDFLLDAGQPVAEIVYGTMLLSQKIQTVTLLVPNDPLLAGTTHSLQGLAGGGFGGANEYLLTNLLVVLIQ